MRILKQLTPAQKWTILLSILTLLLGLGNLGRAALAIHFSARLPGLPTTVSLRYLAVAGAFWGIAYLVCTAGLSFFLPWGRRLTLAVVPLHQAHVWADRLLFDASDYARQIYPRDLAFTLVLLLACWAVLNRPCVTEVFRKGQGEDRLRQARP